jgi:hypothetical protein
MSLPASLLPYLDTISEPFGGQEIVRTFVDTDTLSFIISYPGFIYVASPWSSIINLVDSGYIPGTQYTVYTRDKQKLYSYRSSTGFFGEAFHEQTLMTQVSHGDYLLVSFDSETEPVSGLIWVCNKIRPKVVTETINIWKQKTIVLSSALNQHEAFIDTSNLFKTDLVKIHFIPGTWSQHYSKNDIKIHPLTQVSSIFADGVVTLYPRQTGWYTFELLRNDQLFTLELNDIKGPATNRIRKSKNNSYYVELNNTGISSKNANKFLLPSLAKSRTRTLDAEFIHLEATFDIVEKYIVTGTSTSTVFTNTIKSSSLLELSGSSKCFIRTRKNKAHYVPITFIGSSISSDLEITVNTTFSALSVGSSEVVAKFITNSLSNSLMIGNSNAVLDYEPTYVTSGSDNVFVELDRVLAF